MVAKPQASIRAMTADDLQQVLQIERLCHTHPWAPSHFSHSLELGNLALVLEEDYAIIGYAIVSAAVEEAELLNIAISPDHQRRGYAHLLLESLCERLRGRATTLFLEVRVSNQSAIELYHQFGFNQVGERPNYYPSSQGREDALIFAYSFFED